jgi:hypothetical protein
MLGETFLFHHPIHPKIDMLGEAFLKLNHFEATLPPYQNLLVVLACAISQNDK